jgi:hypothetical protein
MRGNDRNADRDASLQAFVAELTRAAYGVALRQKNDGSWVDLELGLWRVLEDTVRTWRHESRSRLGSST